MAHEAATTHSTDASSDGGEKGTSQMVEQVRTIERVPGHNNYYEKDGLRTYGDGVDHDVEPKMTVKRFMSFVAMAFCFVSSQVPVYLNGGIAPYIYDDIGGSDRWIWFVLANLLSLAAVCPFVGSISDLIGRRYVALTGCASIILGSIIGSTANSMNIFICGQVFAGIGAGLNELTALAATSEMAPTAKRGKYVAILIFTILPFCPSVLWGQLIAAYANWRYVGLLCALFSLISLVLVAVFYWPPPRVNSSGLSNKEVLMQIDFLGGLLSISGIILFVMGLEWGGYMYPWVSAHALVPMILGVLLMIGFVFWEIYGAKYPMVPKRLGREQRTLALTLLITFISGANFFAVLMFWPTQSYNVYDHDPVGVGVRSLPIGFGIIFGCFIVLQLLSIFKGRARELLFCASVLMTAGTGAMAISRPDNMYQMWGVTSIACIGIGGIIVPASVISTIVCPDDLIATVASLTLSLRVIGGSIGFCIYYNIFYNKFVPAATQEIAINTMILKYKIWDPTEALYVEVITLTGASLLDRIKVIPEIAAVPGAYEGIVAAGQIAFAEAYKWVYYTSIAFGCVSIIASIFLGDIRKYMDNHVAVVI